MVLTVTEPPAANEPRAKTRRTAKPAFVPFLVVLFLGVAGVVGYTLVFTGDEEKEAVASIEPAPEQPVSQPAAVEPGAEQPAAAAEQDYTPIPSQAIAPQKSEPALERGDAGRRNESESTVSSPPAGRRSEKRDRTGSKPDVPSPKIEFLTTPTLASAATPARTGPPGGAPGSAPSTPDPKPATEPARQPAGQAAEQKTEGAPAEPEPSTPFVDVMKEPVVLRLEKPRVSEAARLAGAKGEVVAQVQIDTDGKPLAARVLRSSNTLMNDAVIAALMQSEYQPAQMTSGPVRCWLTVPFRFK
jgi:TonB family protein